MKKLFSLSVVALLPMLLTSPTFALQYRTDVEPADGIKSFDDEYTVSPRQQFDVDIYLGGTDGTPATVGGVWIDFSGSTDILAYVSAVGAVPPWDPTVSITVMPPDQPSFIMIAVMSSSGVLPDADGDIIVGRVTLECTGPGNAYITFSTIPSMQTWSPNPPYDDNLISPTTLVIHQFADYDSDGICDSQDNCIYVANPGQEDTYPPMGNGIGDACECEQILTVMEM